jgi:hypothetical protein
MVNELNSSRTLSRPGDRLLRIGANISAYITIITTGSEKLSQGSLTGRRARRWRHLLVSIPNVLGSQNGGTSGITIYRNRVISTYTIEHGDAFVSPGKGMILAAQTLTNRMRNRAPIKNERVKRADGKDIPLAVRHEA